MLSQILKCTFVKYIIKTILNLTRNSCLYEGRGIFLVFDDKDLLMKIFSTGRNPTFVWILKENFATRYYIHRPPTKFNSINK
jgi:hypothetical protein